MLKNWIQKHRLILLFLVIGLFLRLVFAFLFTHLFDFLNILVITKSIGDTGQITEGFFVLKRSGLQVQLYGKIWYQVVAVWLKFLELFHILNIQYIFDTKPFKDPVSYMVGFKEWAPYHYQIVLIKLVQLFWDIPLVIFIYKTAKMLKVKTPSLAVLFWAVNPVFLVTGYIMLQSDLAMTTSFMGAVYFYLCYAQVRNASSKKKYVFAITSLLLFCLGTIIKQVPVLCIPFILFLMSDSVISFLMYSIVTAIFYFLLGQPWAPDSHLMKDFAIMSGESTALFNFKLNGVPIFIFVYMALFTFVLRMRKLFLEKPHYIIHLVILILCLVYIFTDGGSFYPQFNMWVLPFLGLYCLMYPRQAYLMLVPFVSYLHRWFSDSDFFAKLLSPFIGSWWSMMPTYNVMVRATLKEDLVNAGLYTVTIFLFVWLFTQVMLHLLQKKSLFEIQDKRAVATVVIITIFLIYCSAFVFDFVYRSRFVIMPSSPLVVLSEEEIAMNEIAVRVHNETNIPINAFDIDISQKGLRGQDYIVFSVKDLQGNIISSQEMIDLIFPSERQSPTTIVLAKPIRERDFIFEIKQKKGLNDMKVRGATTTLQKTVDFGYENGFLVPQPLDTITVDFQKGSPVYIRFRGQYQLSTMMRAVTMNIGQKRSVYLLIGLVGISLIGLVAYLWFISRKEIGAHLRNIFTRE